MLTPNLSVQGKLLRSCSVLVTLLASLMSPLWGSAPEAVQFTSQTSLVLLPVTVTDRYGKTITDLKPEHFRISDGSIPREIVSFGRVDTPVSAGIILDLSASMHRKLPYALYAVRQIVDTLGADDAGYMITFDKSPQLQVPFTREVETLGNGLLFSKAGGNTALYDAIGMGLRQGQKGKGFRKVLLVVSDGGDNRSRLMESELVSAALEADTQIYSIAVHERLRPKDEVPGAQFLERLAKLTGGLKFDVRTTGEVPAVREAIERAMKEQYLLGFKPHDEAVSGKWRKVKVGVEVPGVRSLQVSSKSAYFNP